jgi:hypothetical protein
MEFNRNYSLKSQKHVYQVSGKMEIMEINRNYSLKSQKHIYQVQK